MNLFRNPRIITLASSCLTLLSILYLAPVLAMGDERTPNGVPGLDKASISALTVRERIATDKARVLKTAPLERSGRCESTIEVDGLGDTCRTASGLLRVQQADGSSFTTHGADAPPLQTPDAFLPNSQLALDDASASDINCVPTSEKHVVLVYARPGGATSRYSTIAPKLQQEAMKMSAFIDAESQAVDSDKGKQMKYRCGADGKPTVLHASLSGVSGSGTSFSAIVDGLKALGYQHYNQSNALARYVVFFDGPASSGAAGTGHLFGSSSTGTGSSNNRGGLYAVEYKWNYGGGVPHWDVLLHEAGHNMGALPSAAPNSSGSGHCNDGRDIMCYNDGGPTSNYTSGKCSLEQFDCGRNDYFNPSPSAGSYLANNWNVAASYNLYLTHRNLADVTAPTQPSNLAVTGISNTTAGLSWTASSDARGVKGYRVLYRVGGGSWVLETTTTQTTASTSSLDPTTAYQFAVEAFDAAGNTSTRAFVNGTTTNVEDVTPPTAPANPSLVYKRMRAVKLSWAPSSDNVAIVGYEVYREVTYSSGTRGLRSAGTAETTSLRVGGLRPGRIYTFRIVARDASANVSDQGVITVRTKRDTRRPTAPRFARRGNRFQRAVIVKWSAARDNVGVHRYHIYRWNGRRFVRVAVTYGSRRAAVVRNLRPGTRYLFRVRASDKAGNISTWSNGTIVPTRR